MGEGRLRPHSARRNARHDGTNVPRSSARAARLIAVANAVGTFTALNAASAAIRLVNVRYRRTLLTDPHRRRRGDDGFIRDTTRREHAAGTRFGDRVREARARA